MNRINFEETGGFPASQKTWKFMQDSFTNPMNGILPGENAIISGCAVNGSAVGNGWVVINGELFPFTGGAMQSTIIVRESIDPILIAGEEKNGYFTRWAEFGIGSGSVTWVSMRRLTKLRPQREITMFSGAVEDVPEGFCLCDGAWYHPADGRRSATEVAGYIQSPNLQDKFVVGAGNNYEVGDTGGADEVTLAAAEMPTHNHSANTVAAHDHNVSLSSVANHDHNVSVALGGDHWHTLNLGGGSSGPREAICVDTDGTISHSYGFERTGTSGEHLHTVSETAAGGHTHTVSETAAGGHTHTIGNAGSGEGHENRPPYYALLYIMKL